MNDEAVSKRTKADYIYWALLGSLARKSAPLQSVAQQKAGSVICMGANQRKKKQLMTLLWLSVAVRIRQGLKGKKI